MEVCRLCLDLLTDNAFSKLEESYKKIINDLIPEVNLEITSDPVICTQCSLSINELYTFKILYSENQQHLKQKVKDLVGPKLTEKEILHCQHLPSSEITKERLCRTCLKYIENNAFTVLKPSCCDAYLESMLQICVPDLDLDISRDPVMCEKCFNFLQKFHNLKSVCQEVEEKLKKYHPENSLIDLQNVLLQESLPKTYTVNTDNEVANVKNAAIDDSGTINNVKNELLDDINDVINGLDDSEDFSNLMVKQEELDIKLEEHEEEEKILEKEPNKLDQIMKEVLKNHKSQIHYSCSQCAFTMPNKRHYVMHMLTTHTSFNEEDRLMHFCHLCDYKTMFKEQMKKHIEKDHMIKEKFHCPFCSFQSNYSINLKKHISIHEDMQNHCCSYPKCDFKTSYKFSLQRHEIKIHGNQCSLCQYSNRNRSALQRHLRTVHQIYEIHQCDKCSFKTFYLITLKRHNVREHKGSMRNNFASVKKTKKELEAEEEEEIKNLFAE